MFSNAVISFLVAASGGTWVYAQMQHRNGGLTQTSLIVAVGSAIVIFIIVMFLANILLGSPSGSQL